MNITKDFTNADWFMLGALTANYLWLGALAITIWKKPLQKMWREFKENYEKTR